MASSLADCVVTNSLSSAVISTSQFSASRPQLLSGSAVKFPNLTLESTLQELPLHDYQVEADCLTRDVAHVFDAQPLLPGVILSKAETLIGMISRRRFLEQMSRPYGLDLFMNRPVEILYPFIITTGALVFPADTRIEWMTQQALQRSPEELYEPIVVQFADNTHHLLDFHQLLVAHSQIHQLAQQVIREQSQAQVIQTEKMASLGRLIASVSHEILNPVNFISGNLNYLAAYSHDLIQLIVAYDAALPNGSIEINQIRDEIGFDFIQQDLPNILESLKLGSERLRSIVGGLRTFSHMSETDRRPVDLHKTIDNTLIILNSRLKNAIEVIKNYAELPLIECYSGQLSQVFMNLISNAIDALLEKVEAEKALLTPAQLVERYHTTVALWQPQITITTAIETRVHSDLGVTQWVSIQIADNGPGIPAEIQGQIFESFFTTKPVGQGTGLGLAISRQIVVEKHQGTLDLHSQVGVGTEFKVSLPIAG